MKEVKQDGDPYNIVKDHEEGTISFIEASEKFNSTEKIYNQ